ncbi:hypothetical protein BDP81DRAFT_470686 [Colletotrichum phormii]|uniref:Uncharacterized protein n=1 Tax=Colletotrichum phormii TaxID=359342 RepID=A0AAI9ZUG4_9PEZI|nr:uncharacterized protein BDP81DRAFT_470686 [Colletotrichum phormii]KAK1638427.1 hypothetical protein BDP81DRAFT_470686 [Colletotrichum phormii]
MDHQQAPYDGPSTIFDRLAFLPLELQKHILYDYRTVSSPCLLSLFVPDWAVCTRASDPVNEIYDLQRIDVYTKGGGSVRGRCMASGALVFREDSGGRGQDADHPHPTGKVPTKLEMSLSLPRHLLFNSFPSDPWLQLRLRRNAVTDFRCEMALLIERGPDEFIAVDWAAMTQLETLFLDLRTYAAQGGAFLRDGIRRAAVKMGCLRLRCLVVAGLKTGERYGRSRGGAWETDEEVDGEEVNWVQVFAPALGEGGRLVFVDRRVVDVDWDAWRVRAEAEGLLVPEGEREEGGCVTEKYLRHVDRVRGDASNIK